MRVVGVVDDDDDDGRALDQPVDMIIYYKSSCAHVSGVLVLASGVEVMLVAMMAMVRSGKCSQ